MPRLPARRALAVLAVLTVAGCTSDTPATPGDTGATVNADGPLVIYSGRRDVLVGPLVERFERETGIEVEVKYGTDAELLAAMAEEGDATPADVFWANTSGALTQASARFDAVPDSLLGRPAAFAPASGRWVPVTTRFRVLAYAPSRVDTTGLPGSVMELPAQAALRGRVGWTPTYSSFQDFVSAMRRTEGEPATRAWLAGMTALQPKAYESNSPMLEALQAGEIDVALTNHYYVLRILHDGDESAPAGSAGPDVATYSFAPGDVGNLALVTGAGLVSGSDKRAAALRFLSFLLSPEAQAFAAEEVHEYPVVAGTRLPATLDPLDRAIALSPDPDAPAPGGLEATLDLLRSEDIL